MPTKKGVSDIYRRKKYGIGMPVDTGYMAGSGPWRSPEVLPTPKATVLPKPTIISKPKTSITSTPPITSTTSENTTTQPQKVYPDFSLSPEDIALRNAINQQGDYSKRVSEGTVFSEEEYKNEALKAMQAEIDATNKIYADKIAKAQIEGRGRLGEEGAIQARRGLLGSDFGASSTETVRGYNADVINTIQNELQSKLELIRTGARAEGTKKFEDARRAKQEGLQSYIDALSNRSTVNQGIAKKVASMFLNNDIDPDKDKNYLSQVAKDAGISTDAIVSAYKEAKANIAKETADLELKKQQAIKAGLEAGRYYEVGGRIYDSENKFIGNKYEKPTGTDGLSSKQYTALNQITTKFQADPIINQSLKGSTASTIADQIISNPKSATNQLKSLYVLVKNLDPDSAVREGELALANQTQSYLQQFSNNLARIAKGRVISPDAAVQLANATKELMSAWNNTASKRQQQYVSQSGVLGLGDEFNSYLQGSNLNFGNTLSEEDQLRSMGYSEAQIQQLKNL